MTKLEQKLIELGYVCYHCSVDGTCREYSKNVECFRIYIKLNDKNNFIIFSYVWKVEERFEYRPYDYDINYIEATNMLQSDLKELKEYEQH